MEYFFGALNEVENTDENLERLQNQANTKKQDLKDEDQEKYIEMHLDSLSRILFIYAKLNTGIKYVQGMNEVLAVIYYCF